MTGSYRPTPKAHATLFSKKSQPLYLEHLKVLIGRAGWKVTKLYEHYTFEQERFKKDFILWITVLDKRTNKLFIELSNDIDKTCLTIDCSGVNKNGPGRFKTEANNLDKQIFYFNGQNNDIMFNVFMSTRTNKQETEKSTYFQIDRVRSKTNEDTFEANTLLQQNRFLSGR